MSTDIGIAGGTRDVIVPGPRSSQERVAVTPARIRTWRTLLVRAVVTADLGIIVAVCAVAIALGVAVRSWDISTAAAFSCIGAGVALTMMAAMRCWDAQVIGQGAEEFNRLVRAFLGASLVLALVGYLFKADELRPWVVGVLPVTGAAILAGRYLIRRVLHAARRENVCMSSVLVVGTEDGIADLVARTRRVPHHGWNVVAACTSTGPVDGHATVDGVPVVGDLDQVARHVAELGIDVVAIAPTPGWSPRRLQALAWALEGTGVDLVVDPGLMEIGGPRLHVAPVDGIPMLRLTEPRFDGVTRTVKAGVDRLGAAALLLVLAPVFLTIAVLIKRDGGPVFYRQERIGLNGSTFRMVKFRSMVVNADQQVAALAATNEAAGPLFKMKADPRVTTVGATLRRLSLDELPQLLNVLGGSMSLVGPRPPLGREVATYADDARRKLLVRPGMTGLWQVSGRSDLSWEESVRLDLRYVENWSPVLDVNILWKTVGAVLRGRGAY
ncbi:sugar transferase [Actinomycetospora endophytica]|uniref:Sugar transferase n=1 Tax=Actinomycetospora endophytica TaxID=2291215 RepID=A0ABS8PD07_9PSEU|nr:sugar transferase [Actinomycetospora endophytica]MCD2196163.1 sugar transferase [Actinomycetospora endophytica]